MPDPGWVRIYHPEFVDHDDDGNVILPDPDDPDGLDTDKFALVTEAAYRDAYVRRGWRDLDEDRGKEGDQDTSDEEQTVSVKPVKTGSRSTKTTEES